MKLPRLQNVLVWYPQSDMKLSFKSLEKSFLIYQTRNGQGSILTDLIRVS